MRAILLISILFFAVSGTAQSLKDSLFDGKPKKDQKEIITSAQTKDSNSYRAANNEVYTRQKPWKKFIEINTALISIDVMDSKKVKYGIYDVMIEARIEPDSTVLLERITCDPESSFIVNQFSEAMKTAPKLVPSSKDGIIIPAKFKQPVSIRKLKDQ